MLLCLQFLSWHYRSNGVAKLAKRRFLVSRYTAVYGKVYFPANTASFWDALTLMTPKRKFTAIFYP